MKDGIKESEVAVFKALGGVLPQSMVSAPEGGLLIPTEPLDIRANLKGGDLRFKIGDSDNDKGTSLVFQILTSKKWENIQISPNRKKTGSYIQLIGIADIFNKRVFATLTIGGISVDKTEAALQLLQAESKFAGVAGMVATITLTPEKNSNGDEFGMTVYTYRHAIADEIKDVISLIEQNPDATAMFRELPDYSTTK